MAQRNVKSYTYCNSTIPKRHLYYYTNPNSYIAAGAGGSGGGGGGGGVYSSSSSLQSSTGTLAFGAAKDDLWAAIRTNYNYIMDTNLLDSCKEARCEIEGASTVSQMNRAMMVDEVSHTIFYCDQVSVYNLSNYKYMKKIVFPN